MPAKKKAVVKKDDKLPSYMKQDSNRGSENVTSQDVMLPRIDIIQDMSPQHKKSKPEYIEGAEVGMLFNTLTEELYPDGIHVVPIYFEKLYLAWVDRDSGGGLIGIFTDPTEAQQAAEANEKLAEAIETPTHVVLLVDADGNPVGEATIPMSKSKMKVSRTWNSLVRINGGDRFTRQYRIIVVDDKSDKGEYYNYKVQLEGFATELAYEQAEDLYESIASGATTIRADYGKDGKEGDF